MNITKKFEIEAKQNLEKANLRIPSQLSIYPHIHFSENGTNIYYEDSIQDVVKALNLDGIEIEEIYPIKFETIVWGLPDPTLLWLPTFLLSTEFLINNPDLITKFLLSLKKYIDKWLEEPLPDIDENQLKRDKKILRVDFLKEESNGFFIRYSIETEGLDKPNLEKLVQIFLSSDLSEKAVNDIANSNQNLFNSQIDQENEDLTVKINIQKGIKSSMQLLKPRHEIEKLLESRIIEGNSLLKIEITSREVLDQARHKFSIWNSYNETMLGTIFSSNQALEQYKEANSISGGSARFNPEHEQMNFRRKVNRFIAKIEAIKQSLHLLTEKLQTQNAVSIINNKESKANVIDIDGNNTKDINILIFSALRDELKYLIDDMTGFELSQNYQWETVEIAGSTLKKSSIQKSNGKFNIYAAYVNEAGLSRTAVTATKLISNIKPNLSIMVGICGGRKSQKVNLCDVIIPNKSFLYFYGSVKQGGLEPEHKEVSVSEDLIKWVKDTLSDKVLNSLRQKFPVSAPRLDISLHTDPMCCGDLVIKEPEIIEQYAATKDRKVVGVDMESYSFLLASKLVSDYDNALVIKTVTDLADPEKGDKYREFCTFYSCALVNKLIEHFDSLPSKFKINRP